MMEPFFIKSLSSFSADIDNLILLVTVLAGFWFVLAEVLFFWLIFRFRARAGVRAQYVTGKEKHLKRWIDIPHIFILICDVVIIVAAVQVWVRVKQTLPPADETVRVIGQQWVWTFVHPGADKVLDTADDIAISDELHVVANQTYHFQLESRDVLHSFFVPVFRLKQDAIPGRTIVGWFKPTAAGAHDILCAEMCGIGHGIMGARIVIETPEEHAAWVEAHSPVVDAEPAASTETPPAPETGSTSGSAH
ncbi:MAG: cytochrome C oxidase subunit II [Candidatus Eisenbacteria bacterium]|uniref:cytochrome-c oxidase n=1 Tax=Eiseniibacteriota bacterium TaxID=2212470 RepID=A0A849SIF6_UNCEI|nr:cytochrome C oxidase subunit II [Candidatus Eisenbacteria bacterium]